MIQPDGLDKKIVKEMLSPASLQWNVRQSFHNIAKRLEVDEDTVRRRVERMRKAGFLRGWQIIVNPHLIGCEAASFDLEIAKSDAATRTVSDLKLVPGVVNILLFYGGRLRIMTYYRSEEALGRQIALMESICGSKHTMLWRPVFPPWDSKMSSTDWSIVATLLDENPRRKLSSIASDAGVSSRTLNRRITRMMGGYAFFLDADVDLSKLGGSAFALLVQYDDVSKKGQIDHRILERVGSMSWTNTTASMHSMFVTHCENVVDGERLYRWVGGLDGIGQTRMGIIQEKITVKDWLSEELESRA